MVKNTWGVGAIALYIILVIFLLYSSLKKETPPTPVDTKVSDKTQKYNSYFDDHPDITAPTLEQLAKKVKAMKGFSPYVKNADVIFTYENGKYRTFYRQPMVRDGVEY